MEHTFHLNYKETFTLNYDEMWETQKAVNARISALIGRVSIDSDEMQTLVRVASLLNEATERGCLAYEAQVAEQEARVLDDPEAVQHFLEGNN
jgi:hypothetical protein